MTSAKIITRRVAILGGFAGLGGFDVCPGSNVPNSDPQSSTETMRVFVILGPLNSRRETSTAEFHDSHSELT